MQNFKHTLKIIAACLILAFVAINCATNRANAADLKSAVVKIYTASNRMDFYRPWQAKGIKPNIGSGGIISGNRILTNAHVVSDHTFVQVKKYDDSKRYTARVLAIGHDCDLALLTVDDPEFFQGVSPIPIGELPFMQDTVNVIGYPTGGDKISVTEGVISRIEVTTYSHSFRKLLTVQIDAAINPGNSGGPVVKDNKIIGVAMQVANNTQNIGYVIPTPIINHFLKDLEDGEYDGFPGLGMEFNTTENLALRDYYKISNQEGGVLITRILPYSPAYNILEEGDVVFKIDDTPIGEDGTFLFRKSERLFLAHLISEKQFNDVVDIQIVRDGKGQLVHIPLGEFDSLIPSPYMIRKPPYYIYGGVIFTVLTSDLLKEWGPRWWEGPVNLNHYRVGAGRLNNEERRELIILLGVLPDDINDGYHEYSNFVVKTLNGKNVESFKQFVRDLHYAKEKFVRIETEQKVQVVLDTTNIDSVTKEILRRNSIPAQSSSDVSQWLSE